MNLRVIPAVASAPTVIFSLNWHSLPSALPFPHYYSSQLVACQENSIHPPRNSLALDKAVGFMVLIDSVTFDLSKDLVTVACNDGQSYQWSISQVGGFKDALEAVLKCVKDSGVEAEKEKKAAAAAALAAANPKTVAPSASQESIPSSTASTSSSSSSTKRHRTASGIFSSLVASFITPTSSSSQSDTSSPAHLAHLYAYRQRRKSSQTFHKQHVDHPSNPRQTFNTSPVPQSRFLRRQARAKLVDIFRFYVASVLNEKMREHGIVGEELKSRGILDDLDEEHAVGDVSDAQSGVGGYTSAGGYVGYMARSQLRNAFAEFAKEQAVSATSSDDHSSSDESILLTPKTESDNSLSFESSATSPRGRRPSSRTSSATSVQSLKIRQLSAVLIGMTQREKRNAEEEKETMDEIKDRSLRRRWSLHEKSRLGRRVGGAVLNTYANLAGTAVPVISSPLREVVVVQDEEEESRPVEVKVVKEKASEDEIIIVMDKRRDEAETAVVKSSEKVDIPSIVVEEIREEITFPSSAVEVSQLESIPFPSVGPIPSRRAKSLPPSATPPVLANDDDNESGELELPELVSEPKEKQRGTSNSYSPQILHLLFAFAQGKLTSIQSYTGVFGFLSLSRLQISMIIKAFSLLRAFTVPRPSLPPTEVAQKQAASSPQRRRTSSWEVIGIRLPKDQSQNVQGESLSPHQHLPQPRQRRRSLPSDLRLHQPLPLRNAPPRQRHLSLPPQHSLPQSVPVRA
ncbi:hypothetical protein FRC03_008526 [Tulasnella sp. 419]|nr:hypothetical protein FRC03_008526 [Tulasnella sp. 419]